MAYDPFTNAKPDGSVDTGPQVVDYTRKNLMAMRDAVVIGAMSGWSCTPAGADLSKPSSIVWQRIGSTEKIRATLTWGTTGGATDNVTRALWEYSTDGTNYTVFLPYKYEDVSYDADANVSLVTWANT